MIWHTKKYFANAGQRIYKNAKNKEPNLEIGNNRKLVKHIEEKIIKKKYSPDAVIGEIKEKNLKFETQICTNTLYNYLDLNLYL